MKTIEINKGGFGIASLFGAESTKNVLIEQSNLDGLYLEELGIDYKIGDTFEIRTPLRVPFNGHRMKYCKVHNTTKELIECEFISHDDLKL